MKKLLTSICFALLTFNAFAFDYCHKGYLTNIRTPELRRSLSEIAEEADNRDFVKANELIDKVLSNQTAPEFSAKPNIDGPLALQLKAAKAYYRFLAEVSKTPGPGCLDEGMKNISLAALKENKKAAKGKKWNAYESFYHRLIQYYYDKKDTQKAEEYLNKIYEYNPESGSLAFLYWGFELNLSTKTVEGKVNAYVKRGGTHSPYFIYFIITKIRYKDRDGENVFQDVIDFLTEYPNAPMNDINIATELFRKSLDINNPKQVKQYYNVLNKVAFAQPSTEEGLKLVSRIIDEKKKVEIIFEDIKD